MHIKDAQTPRPSVNCPNCGRTLDPGDARTGYCRRCDDFTCPPQVDTPDAA